MSAQRQGQHFNFYSLSGGVAYGNAASRRWQDITKEDLIF